MNSRPSTSYSTSPPLDLKTPEIQIALLLQITFKTPSNLAELNKLKELFIQSQINQNLLFEKAIKAIQYRIAKSTIIEATNQDLINTTDEARKRKNKVSSKNRKTQVMTKDKLELKL